jgi:hypothetical protein
MGPGKGIEEFGSLARVAGYQNPLDCRFWLRENGQNIGREVQLCVTFAALDCYHSVSPAIQTFPPGSTG